MDGIADDLASRGIAAWNIEYRRAGDPDAAWPATYEDVAAAARHLDRLARDCPLDLDCIAVLGHSAGGHLALWLAAQHLLNLLSVIALAPVANLRETYPRWPERYDVVMGGAPDQVSERYAAASRIEILPIGVPTCVIVGDQDNLAPSARVYAAAAEAAGDPMDCPQALLPS